MILSLQLIRLQDFIKEGHDPVLFSTEIIIIHLYRYCHRYLSLLNVAEQWPESSWLSKQSSKPHSWAIVLSSPLFRISLDLNAVFWSWDRVAVRKRSLSVKSPWVPHFSLFNRLRGVSKNPFRDSHRRSLTRPWILWSRGNLSWRCLGECCT